MTEPFKAELEDRVLELQGFADQLNNCNLFVTLDINAEPDERFRGMIFSKQVQPGSPPFINEGAPDLEGLLAKVKAAWDDKVDHFKELTIRKMALFIIDKVADQGYCTRNDLVMAQFSEAEIDKLSELGAERAQALVGKGPFKIS